MKRASASTCLLLLVVCSTPLIAADSLGRLFFTPAQRASLDAGKKERRIQAVPERKGPAIVKLNGVVVRSDGEMTAWVNGKSTIRDRTGLIRTTPAADAASARVKVPGARSRKLRVGQQLDTRTGAVREGFAAPRELADNRGRRSERAPGDEVSEPADGPVTQSPAVADPAQ